MCPGPVQYINSSSGRPACVSLQGAASLSNNSIEYRIRAGGGDAIEIIDVGGRHREFRRAPPEEYGRLDREPVQISKRNIDSPLYREAIDDRGFAATKLPASRWVMLRPFAAAAPYAMQPSFDPACASSIISRSKRFQFRQERVSLIGKSGIGTSSVSISGRVALAGSQAAAAVHSALIFASRMMRPVVIILLAQEHAEFGATYCGRLQPLDCELGRAPRENCSGVGETNRPRGRWSGFGVRARVPPNPVPDVPKLMVSVAQPHRASGTIR